MVLDHWSDYVAFVYTIVVSIIGVVSNSSLLHVVDRHTPEILKRYSIVMKVEGILCLFSSLTTLMATTRVFHTGESLIFMFQGLCTLIPQQPFPSCFYFYFTEFHIFLFSQFVLTCSYIYFFILLVGLVDHFRTGAVKIVCYAFTILFIVFYHSIFYITITTQENVIQAVEAARPELFNSTWVYNGLINYHHTFYRVYDVFIYGLPILVFLTALYSSCKTPRLTSKVLKSIHEVFFTRTFLLAISTIPIYSMILCNMVPQLRSPIFENAIQLPMVTKSALIPIITIYNIEFYRNAVYRKICLKLNPPTRPYRDNVNANVPC